jgi:erythromycin esterase-like protein
MHHHRFDYLKMDGLAAEEAYFYAAQNARLVKNADKYYRSMYEDHAASWNNRDTHMVETLDNIIDHLETHHGKPAKIIIWAHNSHVGDARATEMGSKGEINIGQLVREKYPESTYNIGFSTYEGTVLAAKDWDSPGKVEKINPGLEGSFEELFHALPHKRFLLTLRGNKELEHYLKLPRLQRAIGVVYAPTTERYSHYFFTRLPYQFDSIIHIDTTHAVKPL